jgi:hypothetical protein
MEAAPTPRPARSDPVPAIILPTTAETVVETATAPEKPSRWSFGHGNEYNYEPSAGRKPDHNPAAKGASDGAAGATAKKPKKKKASESGSGSRSGSGSASASSSASSGAQQNKAVTDMFSNIMGKIKFK